tara:strand:- start:725 stop:958 length:234 start_codon:yes stop_codon:yes gene_type:complete
MRVNMTGEKVETPIKNSADFGSADNKEEIFEYLEELRQSGITNMYGAGAFLVDDFEMNKHRAKELLLEWFDFKRDEQ